MTAFESRILLLKIHRVQESNIDCRVRGRSVLVMALSHEVPCLRYWSDCTTAEIPSLRDAGAGAPVCIDYVYVQKFEQWDIFRKTLPDLAQPGLLWITAPLQQGCSGGSEAPV